MLIQLLKIFYYSKKKFLTFKIMSDEDIIVSYIPNTILTFFKNDYSYIEELLN